MRSKLIPALVAGVAAACLISGGAFAQMAGPMASEKTVMVGGAAMYPSRNIVENAVNSKDHTTLIAAVKAAGLVDTLSGAGPFTVFAPTNEAFAKLPAGTVDTLLKPENKAMLKTVEGESLTVMAMGGGLVVHDAKHGASKVTIADVRQSNGVIHVVDTVLMP